MGSSCSLTQLIFVLSSQGLFLSSLLIFLSPDLFWPRACTWGMLEEWSAELWERIIPNAVCPQLPRACSSDIPWLTRTVERKFSKPVTWFQEGDFLSRKSSKDSSIPVMTQDRHSVGKNFEIWLSHQGRFWQSVLPTKKFTAEGRESNSLWIIVSLAMTQVSFQGSWRPSLRSQVVLAEIQKELVLQVSALGKVTAPGSNHYLLKPQLLHVWKHS